jgi:threonine aldolase
MSRSATSEGLAPADFRSDTVTRPCAEMRRRMARAEVGDDVLGEDPTVNLLEERAAGRFGVEASLFVPSGTMANQIAIRVLTQPGDELLLGETSHVLRYEAGAPALLSGVQTRPFRDPGGQPDLSDLVGKIREDDVHQPRTALIALENTHNVSGGRVVPAATLRAVHGLARERGIAVFLDGARLLNAALASETPVREFTACADLVSSCLSKGLGCPVGSLVLGDRERIAAARRVRKALGGGMRQAGILAAAGLYALEHLVERLREDHDRARRLATGLAEAPGCEIDPGTVETNIVVVRRRPGDARRAQEFLRERGVLASLLSPADLRFVTHRDVDDAAVERALEATRQLPPH